MYYFFMLSGIRFQNLDYSSLTVHSTEMTKEIDFLTLGKITSSVLSDLSEKNYLLVLRRS